MTPQNQLETLQGALRRLRADSLGTRDIAAFSQLAGQQTVLHAALPARFGQVLEQLRTRLESSALFSEESCSFSQSDLLDSLQMWIDKAGAQLEAR